MRYLPGRIVILAFSIILFIFTGCKKDPIVHNPPIAKADGSQTIQLPKDSITLTGSGSSTDSKIVGYLWSQVSGPGVAIIMSPSAPTTVIRGLQTGNYIFQFAVIDEFGLTGVDTVSVTVSPSPIMTLTLQPSNSEGDFTIWGNNAGLDQSNPVSTELGAQSWTYNSDRIDMRGLLKFDLSNIPTNAIIVNAKLSLYSHPQPLNGDHVHANYGSDNSILLQKVTSAWDPSKVNWTHQPGATATDQIEIPSTTSSMLDLTDIDVTKLLGEMVNNNSNYGFLIRLKNEQIYNSRIFCSSDYSDATKHPKLVVTYKIN